MMGLKWLIFILIKLMYLIGTWFDEDQRANIVKTTYLKEIGLHLQVPLTTLQSMRLGGGPTYHVKKPTNMRFRSPKLNQSMSSDFQSDFFFWQMFHHRCY